MYLENQGSLEDITVIYPNKSKTAVNNMNMIIPVNHVIGVVGASWLGKSTLIDMILGLLSL